MSRGIQAVRLDTACWCRECGATQEPCHHLDAYLKSQQREQAERALVAPPRIERNHGLSESDMAYNRKFQERRKKMVAINFHARFAGEVEAGRKRQTIRNKTQARMGEKVQLFTGQRTKACRKIGEHICLDVTPVTLWEKMAQLRGSVLLMGMYLEEFARKDGFKTYADMWEFFKARADENGEYHGILIRW